ncbi:MAG TPA: RHS repeat-associated core domain-containing protein, partial [Chloroflexota bacterium]|nr:RHS repeat-associated core domain-containing protein [Chloroflexota bacterium]
MADYDPFSNFRTWLAPATNPAISNHGFTGHRHNNTGTNNLGLIYMNARYYLPEIGRFVSPDTIVPDPANPQSY